MSTPPYKVFLSHSSADLGVAKLVHNRVEDAGATCFADFKGLRCGDPYRSRLKSEIQSCSEFMLLMSKNFIKSSWLVYEVGIAEGANKLITPILLNLAPGEISDHQYLRHLHAVDLSHFDEYMKDLSGRVRDYQGNKVNMYQAEITKAFGGNKEQDG